MSLPSPSHSGVTTSWAVPLTWCPRRSWSLITSLSNGRQSKLVLVKKRREKVNNRNDERTLDEGEIPSQISVNWGKQCKDDETEMNRQSADCVVTEAYEEVCQLEPMRTRREMRRRLSSASQSCSCEMEEIWPTASLQYLNRQHWLGQQRRKPYQVSLRIQSTHDVWR